MLQDDKPHARPVAGDPPNIGRLQCPNCCQLAFVVRREAGLLHYECALCRAVGACPEEAGEPADGTRAATQRSRSLPNA